MMGGVAHGKSESLTVAGLLFIGTVVALVSSLGAPLIPTIARAGAVDISTAQWALTVTMLVGAVATPLLGRLADGPRRRRTLLSALAGVFVGCLLAALPLGFGGMLVGRGLQGCGVGLGALAMGVARDALSVDRSRRALAGLALTTVGGVGLGYPVTGLLADRWGVHAPFWAGAVFSAAAWVAAYVVVRDNPRRTSTRVDVPGAILLAALLVTVLMGVSRAERWGWTSDRTIGCGLVGLGLTACWVRHELRRDKPLVELRLLSNHGVAAAHLASLFAGCGMYLLLSLITRFVQTPTGYGYGFGASVVLSGLILVPFSVASVVANRLLGRLSRWISPEYTIPLGSLIYVGALALLAAAHDQLWQIFLVMAIAGLGAGGTFAAMPGMIVRVVPADQTASSMALNQVLRIIGFAIGSALSATVLDAFTAAGTVYPTVTGYVTGSWVGAGIWMAAAAVCVALGKADARARAAGRRRVPPTAVPAERSGAA